MKPTSVARGNLKLGQVVDERDDDNPAIELQLARTEAKSTIIGKVIPVQTTGQKGRGYCYMVILLAIL
jgi:hypothetical protein